MALIDMKEKAKESDAYRFRMLGNGAPVIVVVSRAAAQIAGGLAISVVSACSTTSQRQ